MTLNKRPGKLSAAIRYLNSTSDKDILYNIVAIVGPTKLGSIIHVNSDTMWSRVERPDLFRWKEIQMLSTILKIPFLQFIDIIEKQHSYNRIELLSGRSIGKDKYQGNAFISEKYKGHFTECNDKGEIYKY